MSFLFFSSGMERRIMLNLLKYNILSKGTSVPLGGELASEEMGAYVLKHELN